MILKVQRGSILRGEVAEADDITYVVIASDEGDPLFVAEQVGRDHVQVTKANEPTFAAVLHRLGFETLRTTT